MRDFLAETLREEINRASERLTPITLTEVLDRPPVEAEAGSDHWLREPAVQSPDHPTEFDIDEGDLIMVDIQTREPGSKESVAEARRIPRRYAVLAAAAVIVAVVAVVAIDRSEDVTDVANAPFTESSALVTVEAYYVAVEAGDAVAITALFVDPTGDVFEENLRIEVWNAGQGMTRVDRTCTAGDTTPEGFFVWGCEFGDLQHLQQVAGVPATPILQTFTVSEHGIEELDLSYIEFGYGANDAFNAWMRANHPDDAAAADCCGGDTIEEARANGELRLQYADLWAAYLTESGCTSTDIGC